MRLAVASLSIALLVAAGAWLLFLRGGETPPRYTIEFDNAYGKCFLKTRNIGSSLDRCCGMRSKSSDHFFGHLCFNHVGR